MQFELPKLNFSMESITDFLSTETICYHYGKHHQTYITNLNNLIKGTALENSTIEEIIFKSSGEIYNNAAQSWNHTFYWMTLTEKVSALKDNPFMLKEINSQFGNLDVFRNNFLDTAKSLFGSGWTWLVRNQAGKLSFVNTTNADQPRGENIVPLMVCDNWEHAYYIDYRNARITYLQAFWNHIDWDFVEKNFQQQKAIRLNSYFISSNSRAPETTCKTL